MSSKTRLPQQHKNKGLACVAVYCVLRLVYKIVKARQNKQKCGLRQEVSKQKYEILERQLKNLGHPIDLTPTVLSFQDFCHKFQGQSFDITNVLLAFQARAMSTDIYTNAVVELIHNEEGINVPAATNKPEAQQLLKNIPVSLAEVIHVKGLEATSGLSCYLQLKASEDAVVVQLLKLQGAIPIIRSNVTQTAYITFGSSNPIYGVTRNPLRNERSPGGACSGEAVLVSTGGSVLGVGTDVAGGLRIPAHFCGVCGFKPTSGRISQKGVLIHVEGQDTVATCIGPLSVEVAGLVAFMKSMCVPLQHQLDPTVSMMTFNNQMFESTLPLCVGYFIDDGQTKCVPSVRRAVLEAKVLLESAGHKLVPFEPPDLLHMLSKLYLPVLLGDHYTTLIRYLSIDTVDSCVTRMYYLVQIPYAVRWLWSWWFHSKNPVNASLLAVRCPQSVSFWWKNVNEIKAWRQQFITVMSNEKINALLCPVLPFAAVKLGSEGSLIGCLTYCALFNLLDFPAGTVPITKVTAQDIEDLKTPEKYTVVTGLEEKIKVNEPNSSSLGLPVGVQIASLPFHDELVLRVLTDLEKGKNKKGK